MIKPLKAVHIDPIGWVLRRRWRSSLWMEECSVMTMWNDLSTRFGNTFGDGK